MPRTYIQLESCKPSVDADAYIYEIAPLPEAKLAAITSANEVLVVDGTRLTTTSISRLDGAPIGITTLSVAQQGRSLYCGGGFGHISHFDVREGTRSGTIDIGQLISLCQETGNQADICDRTRDHGFAFSRI